MKKSKKFLIGGFFIKKSTIFAALFNNLFTPLIKYRRNAIE